MHVLMNSNKLIKLSVHYVIDIINAKYLSHFEICIGLGLFNERNAYTSGDESSVFKNRNEPVKQ